MKKAHIALTRLLDEGSVVVEVPVVEDVGVLIQELTEVGLDAALHEPPETVDVKALREREGMSQEEFALWYGLDVSTLRNWEQGRSQPDRTSRTMLHMISVSPRQVRESLDRAIAAE
ncbi:helix-turn-helix domain-containing protein [Azospirillum thiophilum]|uniref:helix-turn-helix domain-containing protein n=1 Tax=Azospirillum thiophilum TaxID=528244 RepID=UPI0006990205|nr:helix-turn-helix domain-containing protein [Azospirillum thiophilum]